MDVLVNALQCGLLLWLALLAALVGGRILRGGATTRGFLTSRGDRAGTAIDPERVLTLAIFPTVVIGYVLTTLGSGAVMIEGRPSMPDLNENLIVLLTGGNSLYLAGKISRRS